MSYNLSRAEMRELWECLTDIIYSGASPGLELCDYEAMREAKNRGLAILADKPDLMTEELIAERIKKIPFEVKAR